MPMAKPEDFGGKDIKNEWCVHCCNPDGSHKIRQEVREGMIEFMSSDEGKKMMEQIGQKVCETREEAEEAVDLQMSQMPAWKE